MLAQGTDRMTEAPQRTAFSSARLSPYRMHARDHHIHLLQFVIFRNVPDKKLQLGVVQFFASILQCSMTSALRSKPTIFSFLRAVTAK